MPFGDGTGPMGMGPMTGRGAGFCAGFPVPGYMNPAVGCGMGFGRGRGFRRMFYLTGMPGWARYGYPAYGAAYAPAVDEKEFLSSQVEFLENQLQQVKKRLKMLNEETE
ncbi:MAG: hypothetical protein HPY66_3390 [Firmicutes bacterium]|nr:hypothetical protein [Bacillota bacterium]MDI6706265.1 DUF5320 domain-containing protein [Bacillota bacterium]